MTVDTQTAPATTPNVPLQRQRIAPSVIAGKIGRKVLSAIFVVWAAATITFFIQTLLPGDRATLLLNQQTGQVQERTPEELAPINEAFGFDQPVLVQYWDFLTGLLRGDLGTSYVLYQPVTTVIGDQLVPTVVLTITAMAIAWVLASVSLVLTARRTPWVSKLFSGVEAAAAALPQYWLGIILLVVFALTFGLFPVVGGSGIHGLVLPALTLGIPLAGYLAQVMRTEFDRTMDQPFVLTARSRGLTDGNVRIRHVLRHSLLPGLSLTGWAVGAQFSAAVIAENVFSRPGLGRVLVTAVNGRDLPVVCGIVMLVALIYVIINLVTDTAYILVDPRLKEAV
ncbi:MAG: ABC transporter permease [Yaniella sp.]|uniref:ABC transporter permease n=2 Tax=Yaniella sp. TaxID=2773929 RepID=UPI002647FFC0|nr:ABC transporter permease [Yaniella sp.]MDN5704368.1 ABC transporter permease [Yaniella sp.]MDN5732596.1 ABC transporter permease [Yaniella sp.]MDN5816100.1 ABC transporter permease [Yaniella sp.]MDN5839376.1 ABC transporter permease [Yaniella sp.]MDN5889877.1 ABC transporter permease [Yaniella sp.]